MATPTPTTLDLFVEAAKRGSYSSIRSLSRLNPTFDKWEKIARVAAEKGHEDLCRQLLYQATWDFNFIAEDILFGAAFGGHVEL